MAHPWGPMRLGWGGVGEGQINSGQAAGPSEEVFWVPTGAPSLIQSHNPERQFLPPAQRG